METVTRRGVFNDKKDKPYMQLRLSWILQTDFLLPITRSEVFLCRLVVSIVLTEEVKESHLLKILRCNTARSTAATLVGYCLCLKKIVQSGVKEAIKLFSVRIVG